MAPRSDVLPSVRSVFLACLPSPALQCPLQLLGSRVFDLDSVKNYITVSGLSFGGFSLVRMSCGLDVVWSGRVSALRVPLGKRSGSVPRSQPPLPSRRDRSADEPARAATVLARPS